LNPDLVAVLESIEPCSWRRAAFKEVALLLARTVPDLALRTTLPVHATGSVLIAEQGRILLLWHPKFDRWLQPGGHCDGELDVRAVAAREALEETGLQLELDETPLDVDLHPGEPAGGPHMHLDVRYVARMVDSEAELRSPEGLELRWFEPGEIEERALREAAVAAMGDRGFEPRTSALSERRSNRLS
jgi:8-oxo-dGTP pyrophosphatase MutT (NUDIX family)